MNVRKITSAIPRSTAFVSTVIGLETNYSLPVCFLLKWVIEMHEKVTQGKRPVSIHTGKEEIQA